MVQKPDPSSPSEDRSEREAILASQGQVRRKTEMLDYQVLHRNRYDVEIILQGTDIVYHFFPQRGQVLFPLGYRVFGMLVEDAFVAELGKGLVEQIAQADYYSATEADIIARAEAPDRAAGQETLFVRLKGVRYRLGSQEILVDRLLQRLDARMDAMIAKALEIGDVTSYLERNRWRHGAQSSMG
jgi:hypothetical protein